MISWVWNIHKKRQDFYLKNNRHFLLLFSLLCFKGYIIQFLTLIIYTLLKPHSKINESKKERER